MCHCQRGFRRISMFDTNCKISLIHTFFNQNIWYMYKSVNYNVKLKKWISYDVKKTILVWKRLVTFVVLTGKMGRRFFLNKSWSLCWLQHFGLFSTELFKFYRFSIFISNRYGYQNVCYYWKMNVICCCSCSIPQLNTEGHPVCAPTPVQVLVHCIGWEDCVRHHFQLPRHVGSCTLPFEGNVILVPMFLHDFQSPHTHPHTHTHTPIDTHTPTHRHTHPHP